MIRYFFKNKKPLILWMFFEICNAGLLVYWSFFMKSLSDVAYSEGQVQEFRQLLLIGLSFLLLYALCRYLAYHFRARFLYEANIDLKNDLLKKIVGFNINEFSETNSAKYISLFINDARIADEKMFRLLPSIAANLITFLVALTAMLIYSPPVTLVCIVTTSLQFLPPLIFGNKTTLFSKQHLKAQDKMTADIKDIFSGFEVIKGFNVEEKIYDYYTRQFVTVEDKMYRSRIEQSKSATLQNFLVYLGGVLQLVFSVYLILKGDITMGILMGSMQISNYISNPIHEIANQILDYKVAKPTIERLSEVLNAKEEEHISKHEIGDIESFALNDVSFSYGDKEIIHNINYSFDIGKKYALVGQSGSGKSTMIKLLMGYYDNYKGRILYNDIDLKDIDKQNFYQQVCMIHQRPFLFDTSFRNNITLFGDYSDDEVMNAINDARLNEVVERMGGMDAQIQEAGSNLSGGEQQRIIIARAFLRKAKIIFLDEATSNLDSENAKEILRILLNKKDLTILCVLHQADDTTLKQFDQIIEINDGVLESS